MTRWFSLCALLLTVFGDDVDAADIIVNPGQSIQVAIDSANNGDRVLVQPGTYVETIQYIGKDIEVIGVAGPAFTTIDGGGAATAVVKFVANEPPTARLAGLTVTNGATGVLCAIDVFPIIENCRLIGHTVPSAAPSAGYGAYATPASLVPQNGVATFVECEISGNSKGGAFGNLGMTRCVIADNLGTGIVGVRVEMTDCVIRGNVSASNGGGMICACDFFVSPVTLIRCTFEANQAANLGGGMYVTSNAVFGVVMSGCKFVGNTANRGGGLAIDLLNDSPFGAGVVLNRCAFVGNQATSSGGGFQASVLAGGGSSTSTTIERCTFANNTPDGANVSSDSVTVSDSVFWPQVQPISTTGFLTVERCDVQGGFPGIGNFNADPSYVDLSKGDVHLTAGSPCRDVGGSALDDWDADPIVGAPDVGADEFHPRLYTSGEASAGSTVVLGLVGAPAATPVLLFGSLERADPAIPTLYGLYELGALVPAFPIDFAVMPASGAISLGAVLPAGTPPGIAIHLQAFLGGPQATFTNPTTVLTE